MLEYNVKCFLFFLGCRSQCVNFYINMKNNFKLFKILFLPTNFFYIICIEKHITKLKYNPK